MNTNRAPKPYGQAYQLRAAKAAIAAGCKGNEMGILYCLFMKIDFNTGTTPEIAHSDLGADMGGLSFDTVRKCIRALRNAGIIRYADYRGRGVKWSDNSGHANRYQMALPPIDPVEKTHRGVGEKHPDPLGKNTHHYMNPSLSDGDEAAPSRREVDKVPDPNRGGAPATLGELVTRYGYGRAREIWDAGKAAACAAE